jgi:hypothetical protein
MFPFNPDRVLRVTPKPPAQLTVPRADEIRVGSCYQDEVLQTPVTPVSAEGLASLHNLIKQDAHTLNETSILRLERCVQKLVNAAQVSIAECALLCDEKQVLTRMNNEAKVRRLTKVLKLGNAKVMSFEDIVVVRVARAVKDAEVKGKRSRKRKSDVLEADELEPLLEPVLEPEPEVARAAKEVVKGKKRGRKRKIACVRGRGVRARSGANNRRASAMEGTGSADDMRLLQERLENRFSLPWVRIWFLGVGKSDIMFVAFSA